MSIMATILKVVPDTEYQGTVYEQRVVVKKDDTVFGIFDPDKHADADLESEAHELRIQPFIPTEAWIESGQDGGIRPDPDQPRGYANHTICGTVEEVSDTWPKRIELTLNHGSVDIAFKRETPDHIDYMEVVDAVTAGDFLCVTVSRTDLHEIVD